MQFRSVDNNFDEFGSSYFEFIEKNMFVLQKLT